MTLVTTHIALEGLLVWVGMGSKYRKFFRKHLGIFSLLTLTAAIPDLDTFIYLHRTYLHSLFWPVLLIIGALIWSIYLQYIKKVEFSERQLLISRALYLVGAFIILHSILDLNPGPVMLFYPFDNRLYSFNVGIVWDLDSWYFLHDLNIKWTSVSFNEGINSYFVNLTPAERIAYFGSEFVETFVSEFPIHLLTFLAWLVFFPGRVLYRYLEKTKINNFFQKLSQYKRPVFALSLVLILFGVILGPGFRLHRKEMRESEFPLIFTPDEAHIGKFQTFELDKGDSISLKANYWDNTSNCQIGWGIATKNQADSFTGSINQLFTTYNNQSSLTYEWLTMSYQEIVTEFVSNNTLFGIVQASNITEDSFTYQLSQSREIYLAAFLASWNISANFSATIKNQISLGIERYLEFYLGIGIVSLGLLIFIVEMMVILREKKEKTENEEKDENNSKKLTMNEEQPEAALIPEQKDS
jgi:hypothetical protein